MKKINNSIDELFWLNKIEEWLYIYLKNLKPPPTPPFFYKGL